MNMRYLLWQTSRAAHQPATLVLAGSYIAILAGVSFFVSIEMSGGTITGLSLGRAHLEDPTFLLNTMLPSLANMLCSFTLFLFLLTSSHSGADSLYHQMNNILLVTSLTRNQLYLMTFASTTVVFTGAYTIFLFFFMLVVGIKSGLFYPAHAAASIVWIVLLYSSCSALATALLTLFKKSTTVLILLGAMIFLAPQLAGLHEPHFRVLGILFPPITNYLAASTDAIFTQQPVDNLILPAVVSGIYFFAGMVVYARQDVR